MSEKNIILSFDNVTSKSRKFRLNNVSFELEAGYIYSLVGSNGAGKTTLMRYILSEKCIYTGEIRVAGQNIRKNHAAVMEKIGYVSEDNLFLGSLSVAQNARLLGMLCENFNMERFEAAMREFDVPLSKTYAKMSRGERMKFQLAFAEAKSPCLYLLDEVTAGMDPVFRIQFFQRLQRLIVEENCSVLMTSHILSEIEKKTDYVAELHDGKLGAFCESIDFIRIRDEESVVYDESRC